MKRRENSRSSDRPSPSEEASPAKRRRRRRDSKEAGVLVPAVLPVVVAEAHDDELAITIGGNKDAAEIVPRAELGATLARLVADLGVPTRVEVHESDGRVLVDILEPPPQPDTAADEAHPEGEVDEADEAELVEVSGDEFMPGEAVAVAVILRHTSADGDGQARTLVDPALVPGAGGAELVLLGRISGTVAVRSLT